MPKTVSLETRQRQSRAHSSKGLTVKQERFIKAYAKTGNGAESARVAGYKTKAAKEIGYENLTKPHIKQLAQAEIARITRDITPHRVQRRLDEISHASEAAGQFGPAVRAEELLGKSIGMWVDQTLQLQGVLKDEHVTALLELARRRQAEAIDLVDDQITHDKSTRDDD